MRQHPLPSHGSVQPGHHIPTSALYYAGLLMLPINHEVVRELYHQARATGTQADSDVLSKKQKGNQHKVAYQKDLSSSTGEETIMQSVPSRKVRFVDENIVDAQIAMKSASLDKTPGSTAIGKRKAAAISSDEDTQEMPAPKKAKTSTTQAAPIASVTSEVGKSYTTITRTTRASAREATSTGNAGATTAVPAPAGLAPAGLAPPSIISTSAATVAIPPAPLRSCPHRMGMLEHFKLHEPHPLGVYVPVDAAQTQYQWHVYHHAVDFSNQEEIRALNRWRGQLIRRKTRALNINTDLRAKGDVNKHAGCIFG